MISPRRQAAAIAFLLFFGLGALAIYTANPMSAHSLERRLAFAAEEALYAARAEDWVRMRIDGQTVTVFGQAPSRAAREAAVTAVRRASWAGGLVAGGVTRVVDETRLAYQGEEVRLSAHLSNARLQLTGFAPDAAARQRVIERAERLFPGRAEVELRIAPGSGPEGWDRAVRLLLAEMARLDHGSGRIADERIALTGLASNAQTLATVGQAFDAPPRGYLAAALLRVDGGEFEGRVEDARLCEMLVDAAIGAGSVGFAPGRASLTAGAAGVLRRAGRVFAQCDAAPLIVAVRAEAQTEEAEALALERAEAIIAALAGAGVDRAQFLAESTPPDADMAFRLSVAAAQAPVTPSEPDAVDGAAGEASTDEAAASGDDENDDVSGPDAPNGAGSPDETEARSQGEG